jgi:hypothetical protein
VTIPKRGSRRIEVDGESFRWRLRRRPTAAQRGGRTPMLVAIVSERGGATLLVRSRAQHPSNEVALASAAVTPGHVADYVREGKRAGWVSTEPGPPFMLEPSRGGARGAPPTWPRGRRPPSIAELMALALTRPAEGRDVFSLGPGPNQVAGPGARFRPARIAINGVDLIELVRAAELPHAEREIARRAAAGEAIDFGVDALAGNYHPMHLSAFAWPSRELLGEPSGAAARGFTLAPDDPRRGKATLLGCTCGITECWFLLVSITVLEDVVIWSDFEQFHRPWLYDLGPFVFDKPAYLRALGADVGATAPPFPL